MSSVVLNMVHGRKSAESGAGAKPVSLLELLPPAALGAATLLLGLYIPPAVSRLLHGVAAAFGGR